MTASKDGSTIGLAVLLAGAVAWTWHWRAGVARHRPAGISKDRWEQVKSDYPLPDAAARGLRLSPELVKSLVHANPFSPQRRFVPPPDSTGTAGGKPGSEKETPLQFLYKGRVNLGKKQRAVMEETGSRKTYFLELGQEVAGFKVLDIAENQVVLSDPQTGGEVVVNLATPGGTAGVSR